jgi:D-alanyl-D-alanine dipeptidase
MRRPTYEIKVQDWNADAGSYRDVAVDAGDSRYNDPLVRLREAGIACESYYARTDGQNRPYNTKIVGSLEEVWCRSLVAEKLIQTNVRLKPFSVELFVWDAYRPIETQEGLWSFFDEQVKCERPDLTDEERYSHVLKYVSDPRRFVSFDSSTWPVHTSGGAIDLTLRSLETGDPLALGAEFDEMTDASHSDALERALRTGEIAGDDAALNNRRLLHWAMENEGFVNYPLEYWHFDWGDQMYVHNLALLAGPSPKAAWYGYIDVPHRA